MDRLKRIEENNKGYYSIKARKERMKEDNNIKLVIIELNDLDLKEFFKRNKINGLSSDNVSLMNTEDKIICLPLYLAEIEGLQYETKINIFDGDKFLPHRYIFTKILEGYKAFIKTNGKLNIGAMDSTDIQELNTLKDTIEAEGIYSINAYDDFINALCDEFKIECCYTCNRFFFIDNLDCCEHCDEYICVDCKEDGCSCIEMDYWNNDWNNE